MGIGVLNEYYLVTMLFKEEQMKLKQILTVSSLFVGLSFSANWKADTTNAKIDFTVKGMFGKVHGSFKGL